MRRRSKRLLTAILAVILVLGNAETLLAQSDFYVETEIRSEETTFEEQTPEADEGTGFPNDREESADTEKQSVQEESETAENEDTDAASEGRHVTVDVEESFAEESEEEEYTPGYVMPEDYRDPDTIEENSELLRGSWLESRYVDEDLLNAIPLRDQKSYSTCWAESSIGLAEFSLYKQGLIASPDLSELHLAYFTYNSVTDPLGGTSGDQSRESDNTISQRLKHGGNYGDAANALAGWLGAVDEGKAPYTDASRINSGGTLDESVAFDDSAHLRNMYRLNLRTNPDEVKRLIKEHGAAGVSYYMGGGTGPATSAKLYNKTTNSYYCYEANSPDHGVMIVGWDDFYSRENFSVDPGRDGAWLIRNSWTTGYYSDKQQYGGYFWMSYADRSLSSEAFVFDFEKADAYDNNYQYDGGIKSSSTITKGANVFTVSAAPDALEELGAITVATLGTGVDYTVDVYRDLKNPGNPESGTKVASESGMFVCEGYHRVELASPVVMEEGTVFSVVVTLKGGTIQNEINTRITFSGGMSAILLASAQSGQSFSCEGRTWDDYGDRYKRNLRIKAFTNKIETVPEDFITDIVFSDEPGTGTLTINRGDTFETGYTAYPETARDKRVTWSSADTGIATVDTQGVVTAVAKGSTTITATAMAGGLTRSFDVVVTRNLTGLNITSPSEGKLTAGETYRLRVEAVPTAADFSGNVIWTSSDPDIATIDPDGNLVVNGTGEIIITAEGDGVSGTERYTCFPAEPVISTSRSGQTVTVSVNAVIGATRYVFYRKIPKSSGSTTVEEIHSISAEPGQSVYEYADDITSLEIPNGYLVYEVKAEGTGAASRSSVKVATSKRAYVITYETGIGTNPANNPTKLVDGETINLYPPTAPAGYSSIGWWYEEDYMNYVTTLPLKKYSKPDYKNYTITAKYKPNTYRIAYYPNGGTGSMSDTTATYGSRVSLTVNAYKRQGSTFTGWNTEPDGKGRSYKNKESVLDLTTVNGGVVRLYAQWKTPVSSISLSESSLIMYTGEGRKLTETVSPQYADVREVQWTSSNANVAEVDADGVVSALSNGTAKISCQAKDGSGKKATCSVTVKTRVKNVEISAPQRLAVGKSYKIIPAFNTGDVEPSDKTLAWSSSDSFVATVSQNGAVSGTNAGTVTIKAVSAERDPDDHDIEGTCDIRIYEPVSSVRFNSKTASVGANATLMLPALITPAVRDDDQEYQGVSFVSSNPAYLNVEEVIDGKIAKLKASLPDQVDKASVQVTATAKDGSGKRATCTVTVIRQVTGLTVSAPGGQNRIAVGKSLRLTAVVMPELALNKQVEWVSSDPAVASVDKSGNVKAISVGDAVITAKSALDNSVSDTYPIQTYTALTALSLSEASVTLHAGNRYKLEVMPKPASAILTEVAYSVASGDAYINVDNTGLITALDDLRGKASQRASVSVTASDGVTSKTIRCNVTVTKDPVPVKSVKADKTSLSMGLGAKAAICVSVLPASADNRVLEAPVPDQAEIVEVTDKGDGNYEIKAVGKGTVSVKFVSADNPSRSASCKITVGNPVGAVAITSSPAGLVVGKKTTLRASVDGVGGKAANASVKWTIQSTKDAAGNAVLDSAKIATINEKGVLSAIGAGSVIVRATAEKPDGADDADTTYFVECTIKTYIPVTKITADRTGINIRLNKTAFVTVAQILPENATDQTIRWKSTNENIVRIVSPASATTDASTGEALEIKAVGTGNAKITGTALDGSKKSVTVNVKVTASVKESDVAITLKTIPQGVQVDQASLGTKTLVITAMPVKKSVTLLPVLTTSAFDGKVTFRSTDPNIATVSASGVVSAKAPGTVTIIMRTSDGGYEARCNIMVLSD